ncbi:short-chain dehydrogenase [Fusarium albosuccineum]|uniref:Short-chain dehydrogenase n=1 Tax=Fusarium albosuccineum TaxID=1237068 RepID=A0A8H4LEP7_9HYPO|nr:short-chain dehydrogenase [Fusarium albosuccineum]
MKLNLEGKVVLVSGGSSGIGKAIATDFAREGASVMITARRIGPLHDTVKELEALGGRASYFSADMTRESDVLAAVDRTKDVFGIIPEVVVCNVRSLIKFGFDDTTTEDFRTSSEQCVLSVVHLAKAVLPTWKKTQRAIGLIDTGTSEKIINDADKESRAQAEPQPQISMKRPGRPEEVAAQVVFLASDRASYVRTIHITLICNVVLTSLKVTGQNIVVDGGWTRGI